MNSPTTPEPDGEVAWSASTGKTSKLRVVATSVVGLLAATLGSLVMLAVAILTLFQARRFYSEVMARSLGRFALWLCDVELVVHGNEAVPDRQLVYVSNHTSTLDVFVLIAMGLPNTRFFMFGKLRRILPIGIIGYLIGIFWTVDQCYTERRRKIFTHAGRVLRRTEESVYLSPEGKRVVTGEIGHFNKGSFHMATDLQVPIQPFYIYIPKDIDPGTGLVSGAGRVNVYFMPLIDTDGWRVEDVEENRDRVRDVFVKFHQSMRQT
jgi:1-acyl-sn-glycerol-3-phosphate acyltransferase